MPLSQLKQTGQSLGKTGTVKLTEIFQTGSGQTLIDRGDGGASASFFGYNRVYTDGADDYKQINPFQVDSNDAPNPTVWNKSDVGSGSRDTGYMLSLWDGYDHWSSTAAGEAKSTNLDLTAFDYDSATFAWDRADGYDRNNVELQQVIDIRECASDLQCADMDARGLGVGASQKATNLGDESTKECTALDPNQRYVATITTLWDDRGINSNYQASDAASTKSTLTNGTKNTYDHIFFTTTACPTCNALGTTNIKLTNTSPSSGCTGPHNTTVYTTSAATTIGGLSNGSNLFTNRSGSPCQVCSSAVTHDYAEDGSHWVELSGGTVIDGPNVCGL